MKTQNILLAALLVSAPIIVQSATAWYPLGGGYLMNGEVYTMEIDLTRFEKNKALRGFWIKYQFSGNPDAVVINYSMSCFTKTMVKVASAVYDSDGNMVSFEGRQQAQTDPELESEEQIMAFVCRDYTPPRTPWTPRPAPITQIPRIPGRF